MRISFVTAFIGFFLLSNLYACKAMAEVDTKSGNYMLPHCRHVMLSDYNYDVWDGECSGAVSTLMYMGDSLPKEVSICSPKGSTQGQGVAIVIRHLESRPEILHRNFIGLAAVALHQAWPCK